MSVMSRKEVYDKMVQESAICWWKLYQEEHKKRVEIETKYERLTRKIKKDAIDKILEKEISPFEQIKQGLEEAIDFGAGPRKVQHIMKKSGE